MHNRPKFSNIGTYSQTENIFTNLFICIDTFGLPSWFKYLVKNVPSMQETWVRSLAWEYPLDKWITTHSSILTWRIPWTVEPCGPQSMESERVRCLWATNTFTFIMCSLIYFHRHTHVAIHIPLYKMLTCPLRHQHAYKFIHRQTYMLTTVHSGALICAY